MTKWPVAGGPGSAVGASTKKDNKIKTKTVEAEDKFYKLEEVYQNLRVEHIILLLVRRPR